MNEDLQAQEQSQWNPQLQLDVAEALMIGEFTPAEMNKLKFLSWRLNAEKI